MMPLLSTSNHRLVFKDSQSITKSKGPWEDPERFSAPKSKTNQFKRLQIMPLPVTKKNLMYSAYLIVVFVTGVCM
jgi:hypothetical protein